MKNKRYRIFMSQCYSVDIEAGSMKIVSINDNPVKIKFFNETDPTCQKPIAEFYMDKILGWAEYSCLVDYTG